MKKAFTYRVLLVLSWVVIASVLPGAAQPTAVIDSLRTRLTTLPLDTNRVLVLDELCWQLSTSDLTNAIRYGRRGLALARQLGYRRGQLNCLNDLGNCAMYGNDFPAGTRYFLEALRLARQKPVNWKIIGFAYNGLASLHLPQKEYPEAQHYLEQALALTRQTHSVADEALFSGNLGNVLRERHQYAAAGRQMRRALAIYDSLGNQLGQTSCLTNLGYLAYNQHNWPLARQYARRSNALALSADNRYYLALNYSLLGVIEYAAGRLPEAAAASRRSLAYAQPNGNREVVAECYENLAKVSHQQGDFRQAYNWQQRFIGLHDSLFTESKSAEIAALRIRFDTERQENRIRALTHQSQVQQLRAAQQRSGLLALLLGGVVVVVAASGVLLHRAQRRRLARVLREERLRTRIAADLHDEVGTILTRISLQAEMLRDTEPATSPALDRLLGNSRAAARTMRDIVWGIDAHSDTAGSLLDRMRDHLDQSAPPRGLLTQLDTEGLDDADPLLAEVRQQVYLIFKEAVTNAVRHAQGATELQVSLRRQAGQLQLLVADNGAGLPAVPARSGLGLRNMRERAESLGGRLQVGPGADGGFRVRLVVPLR